MGGGRAINGHTPPSLTRPLRQLVLLRPESKCAVRLQSAGVNGVGSREQCYVWRLAVVDVVERAGSPHRCRSPKVREAAEVQGGVVAAMQGRVLAVGRPAKVLVQACQLLVKVVPVFWGTGVGDATVRADGGGAANWPVLARRSRGAARAAAGCAAGVAAVGCRVARSGRHGGQNCARHAYSMSDASVASSEQRMWRRCFLPACRRGLPFSVLRE